MSRNIGLRAEAPGKARRRYQVSTPSMQNHLLHHTTLWSVCGLATLQRQPSGYKCLLNSLAKPKA